MKFLRGSIGHASLCCSGLKQAALTPASSVLATRRNLLAPLTIVLVQSCVFQWPIVEENLAHRSSVSFFFLIYIANNSMGSEFTYFFG